MPVPPRLFHPAIRTRRGMSLVEIVVAMGVFVFITAAILALVGPNYVRINTSRQQSEAGFALQNAANIVRSVARNNWDNLLCGSDPEDVCTLQIIQDDESGQWELVAYAPPTDPLSFTLRIESRPVYRTSPDGNPLPSPGSEGQLDEDARFIDLHASWTNEVGRSLALDTTFLVTRVARMQTHVMNTREDFSGYHHNTIARNELFDGEVRPLLMGNLYEPQAVRAIPLHYGEDESQSMENHNKPVDLHVYEDDLLIVTERFLALYDLSGLTNPGDLLVYSGEDHDVSTLNVAITAIAMGEERIYVGTAQGIIFVLDKNILKAGGDATINDAIIQQWVYPYFLDEVPISRIVLDEKEEYAYVGRRHGGSSRPEFLMISIAGTNCAQDPATHCPGTPVPPWATNPFYPIYAQHMDADVFSIAVGDTHVYVGTEKRIYAINKENWNSSSVEISGQNQRILDLAVDQHYLYVGLDAHASAPQLIRYDISGGLPTNPLSRQIMAGGQTTAVRRVLPAPDEDWIILSTDAATRRLTMVYKANLEERNGTNSDVDMSSVSQDNGPDLNINTPDGCRGIAYETNRIFFLCGVANGPSYLVLVEGGENPVAFPAWASYTSFPVCPTEENGFSDVTWNQLFYEMSGLGLVQVFVRTADSPENATYEPWVRLPAVESHWHDLSSLQEGPCIQVRAVFEPTPYCPLYLENILITYVTD